MQLFQRILCPVDFSKYSEIALQYAVALAGDHQADLVIYHSVPDLSQAISYLEGNYMETVNENLQSSAGSKLEEFIKGRVPEKLKISTEVGSGNPTDAILRIAKERSIDLIVMGTHGYTGPERFFLGSVTNKVLHKSIVPVLVVCQPSHHFIHLEERMPVQIKRILCPVDLEPNNARIRDLALAVGRAYQSEVIFQYILPKRANGTEQEPPMAKLRELVNPEAESWCTIQFQIRNGEPAQEILNTIDEQRIDLVVMGHHTRKPIEEIFLGSVAKRVVVDSKCPVLVVRSRSELIYP